MHRQKIVARDAWLERRKALLVKERELTHLRDRFSAERRALPWVKIDKTYLFDAPEGKLTLGDLFDRRSQLVVYHFMLTPGSDHICDGCAFMADHVDAARLHFERADLSFAAVSRAPLSQIELVKRRMGWRFRWVSSYGSDFNYDYGVSFTDEQLAAGKVTYNYSETANAGEEMPGTSVFYKDADGTIAHTYSSFARGGEPLLGTYAILDMTPKGRDETGPRGNLTDWVRLHDRYD